ncbi:MAG: serine hydrolase, partial [Pseudomonadota bacterium]
MAAVWALCALSALAPAPAAAAPYAALVMDARTGEVLHARSADRKLHPASLTKMMTLYMAIEAVKRGRLGLDQRVRVSRTAAKQPPSKIGLRAGQRVTVRHLMRASAVKSANDAATALAEATVRGSVSDWAKAATAKARALGMRNTT